MRPPIRWPLLTLLYLGVCVPSGWAQNRQQQKKQPSLQDLKDVTVDGTVKGVQGNMFQVAAAAGHPYYVMLYPGASKLGISGMAKPDFLKPGMLVTFKARLPEDKKGEVESPPTELRIVSPSEANTPGVVEEREEPGVYYVVGKVSSYKEDKLTVSAGRQVVVPVPPEVEIKVESTDPAFIRPGDSIKVMGKEVRAYKSENNKIVEGQVVAQTVDVKLQETLTAATFSKKKPAGK